MSMTFTMPRFADMHVHFREIDNFDILVPQTSRYAAYAVAMPNTKPPLVPENVITYKEAMIAAHRRSYYGKLPFEPLPAIKILPSTTADNIKTAHELGVRLAKFYPAGATTNSADGMPVESIAGSQMDWLMEAMSECGMILSIHAEDPRAPVMDRETAFLKSYGTFLEESLYRHARLRIIIEHMSTDYATSWVYSKWLQTHRVAGTITLHHLCHTLDDVIGEGCNPHNVCKPPVRFAEDRERLLHVATGGFYRDETAMRKPPEPCFFLGSDSAPHRAANKESKRGASGCFTAPYLPEMLAEVFYRKCGEDVEQLRKHLTAFAVENGCNFYGLPIPKRKLMFIQKEPWVAASIIKNDDPSDEIYRAWGDEEIKLRWSAINEEDDSAH